MKTIFINKDTGEEWERFESETRDNVPLITIRPKVEKQAEYNLLFWNPFSDYKFIDRTMNLTRAQASAVAEAVKALVEWVQKSPTGSSIVDRNDYDHRLKYALDKAWELLNAG